MGASRYSGVVPPEQMGEFEVMLLAIRILQEITENRSPREGDVDALRELAGESRKSLSLDELCCQVIEEGMKRHNAARRARVS